MSKIRYSIQWHATQPAGSGRWIGVCEPMNLSVEADSRDELHSVIDEAIQLLLTDLFQDNALDRYLHERGWTSHGMQHGIIHTGCVIHHVDKDSLNDTIENLSMLTRAEHIEIHKDDLIKGKACRRVEAAAAQPDLFRDAPPKPVQTKPAV